MKLSRNYGIHYGVVVIRGILLWGLYWGAPLFRYFGKLPYVGYESGVLGRFKV